MESMYFTNHKINIKFLQNDRGVNVTLFLANHEISFISS